MGQMIQACLPSRRQFQWLEESARGYSWWHQESPRASFLFWHGSVWDFASVLRHFLSASMLILLSLVTVVGVV
jgi:hypothetical protein